MFPRSIASLAPRVPTLGAEELPRREQRRDALSDFWLRLSGGILRRWRREQRRRRVGRAYDMALEIAQMIPHQSCVLDVGCGNGFISHHLMAMVGANVKGIDLAANTEAQIDYQQFDGTAFPVESESVDAVLLCYVLHHAQALGIVLNEVRRTLSCGGTVVVYEDIPRGRWDRIVCGIHDRKWRGRTGKCRFQSANEWRETFSAAGFEVVTDCPLSRWRNLAHPVSRQLFKLKLKSQTQEGSQRGCEPR